MAGQGSPGEGTPLAQAAEWFAVLQADVVDPQDRLRWQQWLEADVQHAQAWKRVEAMSQRFDRLPTLAKGAVAMQALQQVDQAGRRRTLKAVAAMGVGGLSAWTVGRDEGWLPWRATYRTAIGTQQQQVLADGSRLWLNTASAVRVAFHGQERRLHLLKGELLVETAPDPRPFWVETLDGQLQALGTRFGVDRHDGSTQVSVFEGAVEVQASVGSPRQLTLQAGQQLRLDRQGLGSVQTARAAREAWTRGLLVADDLRLADFLADLGRYQAGYLGCAPEVAELRLVGAFPLADVGRIYAALERALPVRVTHPLPWWRQVESA